MSQGDSVSGVEAVPGPKTLAVDIGGTGVKVIVLDSAGNALTERGRIETPHPATPDAVIGCIKILAGQQGEFDRVSVGYPGVVRNGVTMSAANMAPQFIGYNLAGDLEKELGKPTRVANDADVQGFGAISNVGLEMVITLGTGLGSALFMNGRLVPNLELAHHPFRKGKTYEENVGKAAMELLGKKKWNKRVAEAIALLDRVFNYDTLYIGGGNAKKIKFELPPNVKTVPNVAGLLGGIALWRE